MKKIFLFLVVAMLAFSCNTKAQLTSQPYGELTVTGATLTNADTAYAVCKLDGGAGTVSISATVTRTSGTLAGGGYLFGSIDGTNYEQYSTTDTMAIANPITFNGVTQITKVWKLTSSPYRYYRIMARTTGTSVGVLTSNWAYRISR